LPATAALGEDRPLELALALGKTKTTFDYADTTAVDTEIQFIEVNWYERFSANLEVGLHAGKAFATQTGRNVTAGLEPDGYQAGIGVRAEFLQTSWLQPFFHATYFYRRVTHDDTNRSVALAWHEPMARLGVATKTERARLYGGVSWSAIDGRERITGTAPSTTDFERSGRVGGFLGADLAVEQDGHIGAEVFSGTKRGLEIYFKKGF
jgi:hypothetical protein